MPRRGVGPSPRWRPHAASRHVLWCLLLLLPACRASAPPAEVVAEPSYVEALEATVAPPAGWNLVERETERGDPHFTWVSPTGETAYGVIRFSTPVPVGRDRFGHEAAFRLGYLPGMRAAEGSAEVLDKSWDEDRAALRADVVGGKHTVDLLLLIRGWRGWGIYAGTLTGGNENPAEIAAAEAAREATVTDAER